MTREKAKEIFLNRGFIDGVYDGDKWREACVVISKWLEQEPTTKNDLAVDCVNRVELLKAMDTWDKFGYSARYGLERLDKDDKGFVPYVKYDDMVNCVKNMPSVTPQEPRKGHWILAMPGGAEEWAYKCSECNFYKFKKTINLRKFKYCPSCGAKMVEPQESEDME